MTKLMLAGVAALALSTGAAFAATTTPAAVDFGNGPVHHMQSNQHYDYVAQQRSVPAYTTQNDGTPVVSHPFNNWIGP